MTATQPKFRQPLTVSRVLIGTYAPEHTHGVQILLKWSVEDPCAVRLLFRRKEPIEWMTERAMLTDALARRLHDPVGDGDIRIQPVEDTLEITLENPTGRVVFAVSRRLVEDFLARTLESLPLCEEAAHVHAELDALLANGRLGQPGEQANE